MSEKRPPARCLLDHPNLKKGKKVQAVEGGEDVECNYIDLGTLELDGTYKSEPGVCTRRPVSPGLSHSRSVPTCVCPYEEKEYAQKRFMKEHPEDELSSIMREAAPPGLGITVPMHALSNTIASVTNQASTIASTNHQADKRHPDVGRKTTTAATTTTTTTAATKDKISRNFPYRAKRIKSNPKIPLYKIRKFGVMGQFWRNFRHSGMRKGQTSPNWGITLRGPASPEG